MGIRVFVTGSCQSSSSGTPEEFQRDCTRLGELLVKERYEVLICALGKETADRYVFEGVYRTIKNHSEPFLAVRLFTALHDQSNTPENRDVFQRVRELESKGWAKIEWGQSRFWAIAHTKASANADLLFVVPGKESDNVAQIISIAQELRKMPVLTLTRHHQQGCDLYNSYSQYYRDRNVPDSLYSALEGSLDDDICRRIAQLIKTVAPQEVSSHEVFVVHGHNHDLLNTVTRQIEKLGLKVTILQEKPDRNFTIIEKFEKYSCNASFSVVLMTADDVGRTAADNTKEQARARQNVIFELGYFIGKLGRNRVFMLHEKDVEVPSDLSGVLYTSLDNDWPIKLAKALHNAGLSVDFNKIL